MDIQKDSDREAFEAYMAEKYKNLVDRRRCLNNGGGYMAWDMNVAWQVWLAAKAQAVPNVQQALNDRLLVRSIKEQAESHIAEISVNDLFDKGWFAAMKCIQSNIDMLEAREQNQ